MLDLSHNELDDSASTLIGKIVGSHGRMRDEIMWVNSIRGEKPDEDPELKGAFSEKNLPIDNKILDLGVCELNLSYNALGDNCAASIAHILEFDSWIRVTLISF